MNKFYKRFVLLISLVLIISGVVIYSTVDINTLKNLGEFKWWSIALAIFAVGLGLFFDGSRLMHLVKISNESITLYEAVQVIFGNYFLALHAGVPTGKAAVLVIVRTLLSIFFLACCMPLILLHDKGIVPGISNEVLMAITLAAFFGILFIVWGARRGFLDYFVIWLTRKFSNQKGRKIIAFYRDTKSAISLLLKSPRAMLLVFFESGLNLLCIYAIVPCLLLGLGVYDADWYSVMGRMIFLNMLLYFMPTPGGSGVAEGGFVLLFSNTVPAGTVGIIAVCWRLIAEYIPFLIGLYYTLTVFGRDFLNRQLTE